MNHHKLGDMQVMMINHGRFWGPWRAWESPRKLLEVYSWPNHQWSMAISGTNLLEVPTIYKAYIRTIFWGISHKIWPDMVQYLHFRILKFPLNSADCWNYPWIWRKKWVNRYNPPGFPLMFGWTIKQPWSLKWTSSWARKPCPIQIYWLFNNYQFLRLGSLSLLIQVISCDIVIIIYV